MTTISPLHLTIQCTIKQQLFHIVAKNVKLTCPLQYPAITNLDLDKQNSPLSQ